MIKLIQIDCGEKINGQFKTIDDQIKDAKYIWMYVFFQLNQIYEKYDRIHSIEYGNKEWFEKYHPDACGCCVLYEYIFDNFPHCDIHILNDISFEMTLEDYERVGSTLAHEIGHYIAYSKSKDLSEKSADLEALKLVQSLLLPGDEENPFIVIALDCFFSHKNDDDEGKNKEDE